MHESFKWGVENKINKEAWESIMEGFTEEVDLTEGKSNALLSRKEDNKWNDFFTI